MLSAVLDRLTGLTSKYFVIGAFVPVLVFGFLNGMLAYIEFDAFRAWARPQVWGTARVFDAVSLLIGLAVAAYVLWSLNGLLRQTLEGGVFHHDRWFIRKLRETQLERSDALWTRYANARDASTAIADSKVAWRQTLSDQAKRGLTITHAGSQTDNPRNDYDGTTGEAADALKAIRELKRRAESIPLQRLQEALQKLGAELAVNNVRLPSGQNRLARDRRELIELIDYAEDDWKAREIALANELQSRFGAATATAPTAFGNVALSMQSYSLSRYRLNLATFWSRLQPVLQKDKGILCRAAGREGAARLSGR